MEDIIANTDRHEFNVVKAIQKQDAPWMLPFQNMDKSSEDQCLQSIYGRCPRGPLCPYRHIKGSKGTVCNFWLRGICKKGDDCEFLHLYIEQLMPECFYFQKHQVCNKEDCKFKHVTEADRVRECAWYARGFCRNGKGGKELSNLALPSLAGTVSARDVELDNDVVMKHWFQVRTVL
eukprot:TRINITY_DN9582_c0_g2_i2.p1 TRINITY_DN9582_c0_g2~~TRINITY_DN9582_c0_g2_i2.p1  ORF type:complete len:177 (+),score=20.19 TRINITY_DN9582_c0_g2_i2:88-618(+)